MSKVKNSSNHKNWSQFENELTQILVDLKKIILNQNNLKLSCNFLDKI